MFSQTSILWLILTATSVVGMIICHLGFVFALLALYYCSRLIAETKNEFKAIRACFRPSISRIVFSPNWNWAIFFRIEFDNSRMRFFRRRFVVLFVLAIVFCLTGAVVGISAGEFAKSFRYSQP